MSVANVIQYAVFTAIVLASSRPIGCYLAAVFERRSIFEPLLHRVERLIGIAAGTDFRREMRWKEYAVAFTVSGAIGVAVLFGLLMGQRLLPGGPDERFLTTPMTVDLAANTAVSFATTTTWQAYGGERTMRYATQLVGLAGQGFLAGGAGLALGVAFIRGFAASAGGGLGNFWSDWVRACLGVLMPAAIVVALVLVATGVPMNFNAYVDARGVAAMQTIPQGPVAAFEAIKNLGTNGGGFFNANAAHPYETPTGLANVVNLLAIVVLPTAMTNLFGRMTGRPAAGRALLAAMTILLVGGLVLCDVAERRPDARYAQAGVAAAANLEGKEARFGIGGSVLAAVVTSNGATGSYNAMHDSFTPVGVAVLLSNLLLGEIAFGGLGTGLVSLIMVALAGVYIAGLMVGRTPEYSGIKLGPAEVKWVAIHSLIAPCVILPLTAIAVTTETGLAGLTTNSGAWGLTEILFAYASSVANNGQNMAGLSANSAFYNASTALAMLAGRFGLAVAALGLAGRFARQDRSALSVGAMPSHGTLFVIVALGSAVLIGGLCYVPALILGPISTHLTMRR